MRVLSAITMLGFAALVVYATSALPPRGDPDAPSHQYLSPYYIERSAGEVGTPNIVTAVLGDYRSYDTLGETAVIFTAGVALLMVLGRGRKRD